MAMRDTIDLVTSIALRQDLYILNSLVHTPRLPSLALLLCEHTFPQHRILAIAMSDQFTKYIKYLSHFILYNGPSSQLMKPSIQLFVSSFR